MLTYTGFESTALLHLSTLPVSFGLLAFVFAGHAVFPAIYTSMAQPEEYEGMLNKTYAIVGLTCLLIGGAGEFILIRPSYKAIRLTSRLVYRVRFIR